MSLACIRLGISKDLMIIMGINYTQSTVPLTVAIAALHIAKGLLVID